MKLRLLQIVIILLLSSFLLTVSGNINLRPADNVAAQGTPGVSVFSDSDPTTDEIVDEADLTDLGQYIIALDTQPAVGSQVIIDVVADGQCRFTNLTGTNVFDTIRVRLPRNNGSLQREVFVIAIDDTVTETNPHPCTISHSIDTVRTTDPNYAALVDLPMFTIDVLDDDPIVGVSPATVSVDETGPTSQSYDVILPYQPNIGETVTITPSGFDTSRGVMVSPAMLTYDSNDWDTPKQFTVTAVDDLVDESFIFVNNPNTPTITHTVSTDGDRYGGAASAESVDVTVTDNDMADVIIVEDSITTSEHGTSATFDVMLATEPNVSGIGFVLITFSGLDASEGTLAPVPTELLFNASNWDMPQTITVTGLNDGVIDGDQAYTLTATGSPFSSDNAYSGVTDTIMVTNEDIGVPGITISPTTVNVDETGPTSDTYTVTFTGSPDIGETVTIAPSGFDTTLGVTVNPPSLMFDSNNWKTPQTVTVTAVDDPVDETLLGSTDNITNTVSTDVAMGAYDGITASDVMVNITDNDVAGVTIVEDMITTDETGTTATFDVQLDSQPSTGTVTVEITGLDMSEGSLDKLSLTFDTSTWNFPQTVTVTGLNDGEADGDIMYTLTATATSADDANYLNLADTISVTNTDIGIPTVTASPLMLTVDETGPTSAIYTVSIDQAPNVGETVTVTPVGFDTTLGVTVSPAFVTFTLGDWMSPKPFTVTAVDDAVDETTLGSTDTINHDVGTTGGIYDLVTSGSSVMVDIIDNDAAGLTIIETAITTDESGTTATFDVRLNSQPSTGTVTVEITGLDTSEGSLDKLTLTFNTSNWNVVQTVTVTGVDDNVKDNDVTYNLTATVTAADDGNFLGTNDVVSVTNTDDDVPNVLIIETAITTGEDGTSALFNVVLTTEPLGDVTVTITGLNLAEGDLNVDALTFTAGNWNVPHTVTVTGVDDDLADGNVDYTLTATSSSAADPDYATGLSDMVTVTNVDDDITGILVSPTTGLVTDESGGTDTFAVVLTSEPFGDVVIGVVSSDTTEGTVSSASLTFTAMDWNVPQTVTVTGVDDFAPDGDIAYTIVVSVDGSTADAAYVGLDPDDVSVTNVDNDNAALLVDPHFLYVAEDAPGQNSFTVALGSPPQPGEIVTVTISYDDTQLNVSPTALLFDSGNYNVPQVVDVDAIPDDVDEPQFDSLIVIMASSNVGGSGYQGLNDVVTAALFDYEAEIITYIPNHGLIRIDTSQGQPTYGSPSEGVAREPDGQEIWLPQDYDGNGFDTFVVTDIRTYNGQTWLGLWQGTMNWLWVPYNLDMMSIVEPLDWDTQTEWTP